MERCDGGGRWCIDRRVNVGTVVSALSSLAIAAGMIASLAARLDAVEGQVVQMREDAQESRRTAMQVERIDERIIAMHRMLEEIKAELRQRREERR